jgi:hypothetical protein
MLFSNKRKHDLSIPITEKSGPNPTVQYLVQYLCDNLMRDPRKELFVLDDSVYATVFLGQLLAQLTAVVADQAF